jgi:hypothetical protein
LQVLAASAAVLLVGLVTFYLLQMRHVQPAPIIGPTPSVQSPTPSAAVQSPSPTPGQGPSPRGGAAIAWDGARRNVVLFGGSNGGFLADTWLWNGSTWALTAPVQSPPARAWASIAYDAGRQQVVLFGGSDGNGFLNDTWIWDGSNWTMQHPVTSPPPVNEAGMVYDSALDRVVLVDGATWTWDGRQWAQVSPGVSLSGSNAAPGNSALTYDAARRVIVLAVSANISSPSPPLQTWTFDGSQWSRVITAQAPPGRGLATLVYDPLTKTSLFYGGADMAYNDTWSWDGKAWTQLHPATSPPHLSGSGPDPAATYDPERGLVLLFGGYTSTGYVNSLWAWTGTTWTRLG